MITETFKERTRNQAADEKASSPQTGENRPIARGLLVIGVFKLSKTMFFLAVGIGALHLIHSNLGELLLRTTQVLHLDPEWHFVEVLQDKVDLVTGHQLRDAALLSCGYALVCLVEGVGLLMQQTWAEYLTLILTTAALPWELFELVRHATPMRGGLLIVNLAVLAYLLWFIRWHRRQICQGGH